MAPRGDDGRPGDGELIEPLDDESIYARCLAEKGEGVHDIALRLQASTRR